MEPLSTLELFNNVIKEENTDEETAENVVSCSKCYGYKKTFVLGEGCSYCGNGQ